MDEYKEKLMAVHEKATQAVRCPWCGIGIWYSDFTNTSGMIDHADVFNRDDPASEVKHEVVCPHCEKPITMYALHTEYDNVEFEKREA